MLASLAAVSVAAGPASHAHPVASKRPRNQIRRPQMADGSEGAGGEIGQSSSDCDLLRDP